MKERELRKQQHLLEQTAVPKDGGNCCVSAENTTGDEALPQDSQAGIFQGNAVIQYIDWDLWVSTLGTSKNSTKYCQTEIVTLEFSVVWHGLI